MASWRLPRPLPPGHWPVPERQVGAVGSDMRVNWNFIMKRVVSVWLGKARCHRSKWTRAAVPAAPRQGTASPTVSQDSLAR